MGATYTRQSTFTDGDVIDSDLFNNEFDQLLAAFASSTGHTHDGTAGEGGPVTALVTDGVVFGTNTGDITLTWNAGTNDGLITWKEDEDYFEFNDDILIATTEKIQFTNTSNYIHSASAGNIDLVAATEIHLTATTINMDGAADISGNLSVGGNLDVTGTFDLSDANFTNAGNIQLDSISGDGDTDTSITFNGSNIITFANGGANQVTFSDGSIAPVNDSDINLGANALRFKDAYIDSITVTGEVAAASLDISGNIDVDGVTNLDVVDIDGAVDMASTLAVAGVLTGASLDISGDIDIDGTANLDIVDIDGAVDMATTLTVAGNVDFNGDLDVDGTTNLDVVDIDGAVDMATTLTVGGEITAASLDISGNVDIDGTLETDALSINSTTVTSTAAELNILDGVTATATELNLIDGVTATTAELNILDGVTASADDINLIDGITNGTVIASKAIITDSNKDITGGRNITISGELDAATLDISGDADIDGTLEADAITIGGVTLAETISDTVGAMVTNNTESGITVTYDDSDNTLDFTVGTLNQDTTGTAAIATTVTITDNENTNENNAIVFTSGGDLDGGNIGLESDGDLKYNPSTGTLSATNISVSGTFTTVDSVTMNANNAVVFEGATADAHETTLTSIDATGDRTISLPNVSGTLPVLAAASTTQISSTPEELNILDGVTSTTAELNILDGVTSTAAELNILDGVTSTATELNLLDGVTSTTAELNILDGVTSTAAELNILDGVTSTTAELNILDGVTASATDLNLIDGITNGTVIASKAIITDANKDISGGRNVTISGELDAATLDISGNGDVAGTLAVSGGSSNGVVISQGAIALKNGGSQSYIDFYCETSNAHYARIQAPAHSAFSGNATITLPSATTTLASTNLAETLTNKTLTSPKINEDVAVTSTATELNLLDGVTSTTAELNILDGVTSTATELNLLDGVTSTTAELNILDGVTSTAAELNILDGVTSTAAELNILDGVTSTAAELNILDGVTATAAELNILDVNNTTLGDLAEISTVANDDVFLAVDASGGGLKKLTRSTIVSGLATSSGLSNVVEDTTPQLGGNLDTNSHNILIDDAHFIGDESGNEQIVFQTTGSAVNHLEITNNASGSNPILAAAGGDTNIGIALTPKGTGEIVIGAGNLNYAGTAITSTGAELNILDGVTSTAAELNILDGVTSTAAELNILDGVTSTAAELNALDGITAVVGELNALDIGSTAIGTAVASKAVILDSNKDYTGVRNFTLSGELDAGSLDISGNADIDGTLETDALSINGTAVTSTAAELNILDGVTSTAAELNILDGVTSTAAELNILDGVTSTAAELNALDGITAVVGELNALDIGSTAVGTAVASKAVILDSNKDYTGMRNLTISGELDAGSLDISGNADIDGTLETDALSINGTAVTSTAAELNILDGVTSTAAELNALDGITAVVGELNALDIGSTAVGTAVASKAVILDSSKDYTGIRNFTITGDLVVGGTTTVVDTVTMNAENAVVFEGATADGNETTLTIVDPNADRTIKLPNQSGTIPVLAAESATAITSTPEELNILDGVTSTAAELNILDGVTSTAAELNALDGITAVVGELNALDIGSTAVGTAVASKAVILDSNKDYTGIRNFTISGELDAGSLDISGNADIDGTLETDALSINGTAVTSTAAELNILDGVTTTAAEINLIDGGTARGTTAVADGDGILINDAGTMRMTTVQTVSAYMAAESVGGGNIVTTGALNSGTITSGFGTINNGSSTITTTGTVATGAITAGGDITRGGSVYKDGSITDTGDFTLDVAGDIILDADGADVIFKDGGTSFLEIDKDGNNARIKNPISDGDLLFQGNDGGSGITALTLDMSAAGAATFNNDVTAFSDERLKSNITTIPDALSKVTEMRGVHYVRNETGHASSGVIAQELQKIAPELVRTADDEMGTLSVNYANITSYLIEAVKELSAKVKELEGK